MPCVRCEQIEQGSCQFLYICSKICLARISTLWLKLLLVETSTFCGQFIEFEQNIYHLFSVLYFFTKFFYNIQLKEALCGILKACFFTLIKVLYDQFFIQIYFLPNCIFFHSFSFSLSLHSGYFCLVTAHLSQSILPCFTRGGFCARLLQTSPPTPLSPLIAIVTSSLIYTQFMPY